MEQGIQHRIAAMLTSAAAETDWRRTWARVNRAAGMVAVVACIDHEAIRYDLDADLDAEEAGRVAERIVAEVAKRVEGDPRRVKMVVEGLTKRVGHAMVEWYTGTSEEEGRARESGEGPEVDNG